MMVGKDDGGRGRTGHEMACQPSGRHPTQRRKAGRIAGQAAPFRHAWSYRSRPCRPLSSAPPMGRSPCHGAPQPVNHWSGTVAGSSEMGGEAW